MSDGTEFSVLMDTSGVNLLLEEEQDHLLTALQEAGKVRVSALSVLESIATSRPEKRTALLELQKQMTQAANPLELPGALVRKCFEAYSKADPKLTLTVEGDHEGAWSAIVDPSIVTDEMAAKAKERNAAEEERFYQFHLELREAYSKVLQKGVPRPASAKEWLEIYLENPDFLYDLLEPIYFKANNQKLQRSEIRPLLDSLPAVLAYVLSFGYAGYKRSMAGSHNGRRNAGFRDLMFSVYLPYVSQLVTGDGAQCKALSLIGEFVAPGCEVLEYNEWKSRIIL